MIFSEALQWLAEHEARLLLSMERGSIVTVITFSDRNRHKYGARIPLRPDAAEHFDKALVHAVLKMQSAEVTPEDPVHDWPSPGIT